MKTTQQLLQLNDEDYRLMIFTHWHQWCEEWAHDNRDAQKLITSQKLFSWWWANYDLINAKFERRMHVFHGKTDVSLCRDFHNECASILLDYFSRPLMRLARNQQPIEPQYN